MSAKAGNSSRDPQTIIEGKTVIRPADPSMDGYDFQGWLLDGKDYDWNTPITGDITLTASWTEKVVLSLLWEIQTTRRLRG